MDDDSPLPPAPTFASLGLAPQILAAIDEIGYEAPTAIQAATIPALIAGRDLLGQAQTGTGKTAAFALPLLGRLDSAGELQILVLTPTRELAIQVSEAMQTYARHLPGFHVLPVYGGQDIESQLRHLRRGVHAVVGTPGRVQDHLRRGTLKLDKVFAVVLDEADEMLRMGFVEEVEAILQHTPAEKQVALFSATLPPAIKTIARRYLRDPVEIHIETKTATVATVTQRYWPVSGVQKLDALTRILEVEDFEAMLIFVRTKVATVELAEKLEARGFACSPLNGDMNQAMRERTIERLKGGQLDIVVATDVAARGLDVERISHVVNFDIPQDFEAYVHRIGRTGRAGREGVAILFVSQREQYALRAIEKGTRQPIARMQIPTHEDVADRRISQFKSTVAATLAEQDLGFFAQLIEEMEREQETTAVRIGAALAYQMQKERPLKAATGRYEDRAPREAGASRPAPAPRERPARQEREAGAERIDRPVRPDRSDRSERIERPERAPRPERFDRPERSDRPERPERRSTSRVDPSKFERYRLEVGASHGVLPKNIVGAIANEAELEGRYIVNIDIRDQHSLVDLPRDMPPEIFRHLRNLRICGQPIQLRRVDERDARDSDTGGGSQRPERPPRFAPRDDFKGPRGEAGPRAKAPFVPRGPRGPGGPPGPRGLGGPPGPRGSGGPPGPRAKAPFRPGGKAPFGPPGGRGPKGPRKGPPRGDGR